MKTFRFERKGFDYVIQQKETAMLQGKVQRLY